MPLRSFTLCLLAVLRGLAANAQTSPNYEKVDAYVVGIPYRINELKELDSLLEFANSKFEIPEEKVRFAFSWVARNLEYDCREDGGLAPGGSSLENILKTGRSTCSGYAGLMNYALQKLGFESVTVRGVAKTARRDLYWTRLPRPNHAWNAVRIGDQWRLMDATWAAGEASENCDTVIRAFSSFYFLTDPKLLALSHLPSDPQWQLIDDPVDSTQFLQWPIFHDPFYEQKAFYFYPDKGVLKLKKNEQIRFVFKSLEPLEKIAIWSDDRKTVGAEFGKFNKTAQGYEYLYRVKESGDYFLNVSLDGKRTAIVYRLAGSKGQDRP